MGNTYEIMLSYWPLKTDKYGSRITKINDDLYMINSTAEVLEYNHTDSRAENLKNIRRTIKNIRELINTNVVEPNNCRWVTLTYAENMTDTVRLYNDYKKFWQKFLRYLDKRHISKPEYINVIEPQGRGAWHIHSFFIWKEPAPFIPNDDLRRLWSQGFVKITAMNNCDNVGAYFSAYLADIPLDEFNGVISNEYNIEEKKYTDENGVEVSKKIVKGGRLHLYPPGMNIIRHSQGIEYPKTEYLPINEAIEKVSSAKLTFSQSIGVFDGDICTNRFTYRYYNAKND